MKRLNSLKAFLAVATLPLIASIATPAQARDKGGNGETAAYENGKLVPADSRYVMPEEPRLPSHYRNLEYKKNPALLRALKEVLTFLDKQGVNVRLDHDEDTGELDLYGFDRVSFILVPNLSCEDSYPIAGGAKSVQIGCYYELDEPVEIKDSYYSKVAEIDESRFNELSPRDQAFVLVHEFMHSFGREVTHRQICPILGGARTLMNVRDRQLKEWKTSGRVSRISEDEYNAAVLFHKTASKYDYTYSFDSVDYEYAVVNRNGGGIELHAGKQDMSSNYVGVTSKLSISNYTLTGANPFPNQVVSGNVLINSKILITSGNFKGVKFFNTNASISAPFSVEKSPERKRSYNVHKADEFIFSEGRRGIWIGKPDWNKTCENTTLESQTFNADQQKALVCDQGRFIDLQAYGQSVMGGRR